MLESNAFGFSSTSSPSFLCEVIRLSSRSYDMNLGHLIQSGSKVQVRTSDGLVSPC